MYFKERNMIWREKFSWMFLWSKRALGSFIHYLTCTRKWSQALDSIIQKFQRKGDVMFWGEKFSWTFRFNEIVSWSTFKITLLHYRIDFIIFYKIKHLPTWSITLLSTIINFFLTGKVRVVDISISCVNHQTTASSRCLMFQYSVPATNYIKFKQNYNLKVFDWLFYSELI